MTDTVDFRYANTQFRAGKFYPVIVHMSGSRQVEWEVLDAAFDDVTPAQDAADAEIARRK